MAPMKPVAVDGSDHGASRPGNRTDRLAGVCGSWPFACGTAPRFEGGVFPNLSIVIGLRPERCLQFAWHMRSAGIPMSNVDQDDDERTRRGAFWSRFAMTLLSLRASLDSRVTGDVDASGSGDSSSPESSTVRSNGDGPGEGSEKRNADRAD